MVCPGRARLRRACTRSALLLSAGLAVTGCMAERPALRVAAAPPVPVAAPVARGDAMLIEQARIALDRHDGAAAASFAELAVRAAPGDAGARSLLARAYLTAGRIGAAVSAYDDWLGLAPGDAKARLGRALARLAGGDRAGALADLDRLGDAGSAADAGLGYALAGDTARGVELLTAAARRPEATARTRQNLALALALDGQWTQARTVAEQDVDAATADARIRDWTRLASAGGPAARAVTMLAIVPAAIDAGRPVALALAAANEAAPERVAPVRAAPVGAAPARAEARLPSVAVAVASVSDMTGPPLLRIAAVPRPAIPRFQPSGGWVVQLGAYASAQAAAANWQLAVARSGGVLAGFDPARSLVGAGGKTYHRLAVGGFASRFAADALCRKLQAGGRDCIVRNDGPVAPTQLAVRI